MVQTPSEADPDVIFVSYDEPNADANFARLQSLAPAARRLHGIEGIYNAYQAAAELSQTRYFFMIDGDTWIRDGVTFRIPDGKPADIYTWRSVNAVNGLEARTGALKLIRRGAARSMKSDAIDFFASMTGVRRTIRLLASENRFNASPLLTWRGAFRECAKLASATFIDPSQRKLEVWQTLGAEKPFGLWSLIGARMGAELGRRDGGAAMDLINDKAYLEQTFQDLRDRLGPLAVTPPAQLSEPSQDASS
jgi:hypothetical protein